MNKKRSLAKLYSGRDGVILVRKRTPVQRQGKRQILNKGRVEVESESRWKAKTNCLEEEVHRLRVVEEPRPKTITNQAVTQLTLVNPNSATKTETGRVNTEETNVAPSMVVQFLGMFRICASSVGSYLIPLADECNGDRE